MTLSKVTSLIDSLRSLHLVEETQFDKLKQLQARFPDPQALTRKLIEHRWLTSMQANALLNGKGELLLLGSYVLQEKLGEGGMGEVYKARNWKLGRTVALKVIRKDKTLNTNAMRRFMREVQTASQLAHPNIVLTLDAGEHNGRHFMAMEFVDGIDLNKLVSQKGPLPVDEACNYIRQAALGLEHARERGMVHRDIKPSNLLLSKSDGLVKLLDMGLARMNEAEEVSTLTQEGSLLGTVDYLSPEQALDARKADIRSDLYSLGCAFYFLLTGKVPFPGGTATEKLLKHRLEQAVPVEKLRPEVPAAIGAVIRKLLAKKPEDRYQTPADLVAALDAGGVAAGPSLASKAMGGVGSLLGRIPLKWKLRLGGGLAALAALLLLINAFRGDGSGAAGPGKSGSTALTVPEFRYVKMPTREETIVATLKACGYPTLEEKWHILGYFDNALGRGFETSFLPETAAVDLDQSHAGRGDQKVGWQPLASFQLGQNVGLGFLSRKHDWLGSTAYVLCEVEAARPVKLPVQVGADATLSLWLNGERLIHERWGPVKPKEHLVVLNLKAGKNQLLAKVCKGFGDFWFHLAPRWPDDLENKFGASLKRDFP